MAHGLQQKKHLNSGTSDSLRNSSATGTVTFTMGQLTNDSDGLIRSGSQFFFQLPNGHFIVNDGAHNTELKPLIDKMQALANSSITNALAGISSTYITGKKASKILSGINVYVVPHHGMNTLIPFARYLATPEGVNASTSTATMNKFDSILFPYWKIRKTANDTTGMAERDIAYETQDHANQWLVNNLAKDLSKVKHYNSGDAMVTISGSNITVTQK